MRFVEQLAAANNATLFFVGDDWQAINRFAGADLSIFRTYVPDGNSQTAVRKDGRGVRVTFLRKTFRCPQGLADVSRALVLENRTQIDKKILSPLQPATAGAVRVIIHQDDGASRQNCLRAELRRLASLPGPKSCSEQLPKVFVLLRNGKDVVRPEGCDEDILLQIFAEFRCHLQIDCRTMHSSKGLEADYVIIVGADDGFAGVPDVRDQDPLSNLVLPQLSDPIEEERRLFYVALTRARHQVSILAATGRPSLFVRELRVQKSLGDRIQWISHAALEDSLPSAPRFIAAGT